jgi:hypothetical protein
LLFLELLLFLHVLLPQLLGLLLVLPLEQLSACLVGRLLGKLLVRSVVLQLHSPALFLLHRMQPLLFLEVLPFERRVGR